VTIEALNDGWNIVGPIHRRFFPCKYPPPETFEEYLQRLSPSIAALFYTVEFTRPPQEIALLLIADNFRGVSDGLISFHTDGYFGWTISLSDGTQLVRCSGPVYGYKPTSYRAECYGML
jgi:hypothetical protein